MIKKKLTISVPPKCLYVILFVCCLGVVICLGKSVKEIEVYSRGRKEYEHVRRIACEKSNYGQGIQMINSEEGDLGSGEKINEAALRDMNGDYKLWIKIPKTAIDYPAVQCDNNTYYLNHTFTGEENAAGAIFVDFRRPPMAADNTILYGHNMRDGSMFAELKRYAESTYWEEHPNIFLYYQGQWRTCPIFSCQLRSDTDAEAYQMDMLDEEWEVYLREMQEASLYPITTDINVKEVEHIITLSTCYGKDKRMIVQAYLNI